MVKRFDTMACSPEVLVRIEMFAAGAANWFFSNFVPSPTEIVRKTATGGYKRGFYGLPKVKSPLDVIWRSGDGSKLLGRMTSSLTTGFFVMWAGSTAYEAFDTWQSLYYLTQTCEEDPNAVIFRDGRVGTHLGFNSGSPALWATVWNPQGFGNANTGHINRTGTVQYSASWYGVLTLQTQNVTGIKVGWSLNGVPTGLIDYGDLGALQVMEVEATIQGVETGLELQPYYEFTVLSSGVNPGLLTAPRVIYNIPPYIGPDEPPGPLIAPSGPKPIALCDEVLNYSREWKASGVG